MSVARTRSIALIGIEGTVVEVEADLTQQAPDFRIIGLGDRALGEASQRVHNACANSGAPLPKRRLTINLSPASLPKQGAGFDLAIAVAALATEGQMDASSIAQTLHIGELGLDGRLRPVPGVLPALVAAVRSGITRAIVPFANQAEAELVAGIEVHAAVSLAEVLRRHGADIPIPEVTPITFDDPGEDDASACPELAEVIGQDDAVEAMIVAAAGGHHMMLSGPPGAGKTMLAQRLPGLLPRLDDDAALRVASIASLSGEVVRSLRRVPPFEAPHHSASAVSLVGGGSRIVRPGAIARASEGVLLLDEAGEFPASVLDALRQPLESGRIQIHRMGVVAEFPARFQLVLATNPCPCGNYGVRGAVCECPPIAIRRYLGRLSGPLRDRMDIELSMRRVTSAASSISTPVSTAIASARVAEARERAAYRLRETPWTRNADVSGSWLRQGPSRPSSEVSRPLDLALQRGLLTLRGYDRVLRVAWSSADLAGRDRLTLEDVSHALMLKNAGPQ